MIRYLWEKENICMRDMPRPGLSYLLPVSRELYATRVYLRRFRHRDAQPLLDLLVRNESWLAMGLPPLPARFELSDMKQEILRRQRLERQGSRLDLAIFDKESHRLVGEVSLHSISWGIQLSGGLGFWLAESSAGNGLMKEALATMLSFVFEESPLHRIWAATTHCNVRTQELLRRLGFTHDGTIRQELFLAGTWQDMHHFSLLRDEYDNLAERWISKGYLGIHPNQKARHGKQR